MVGDDDVAADGPQELWGQLWESGLREISNSDLKVKLTSILHVFWCLGLLFDTTTPFLIYSTIIIYKLSSLWQLLLMLLIELFFLKLLFILLATVDPEEILMYCK